ncbi:MAG: STAS domain-containing protein [Phycisphaeraceae bacterium]|nr:STAS domain-containing protein [Phycisphaeraceae bacterium]
MKPSEAGLIAVVTGKTTCIRFAHPDQLDMQRIDQTRQALMDLASAQQPQRLAIDLSNIQYALVSEALGMLIDLRHLVRGYGGNLYLCGLAPQWREVFDLTRISALFEFCDHNLEPQCPTTMQVNIETQRQEV